MSVCAYKRVITVLHIVETGTLLHFARFRLFSSILPRSIHPASFMALFATSLVSKGSRAVSFCLLTSIAAKMIFNM